MIHMKYQAIQENLCPQPLLMLVFIDMYTSYHEMRLKKIW